MRRMGTFVLAYDAAMKDLKHVSWGKLLVTAAIAIVPATLSYCKASRESDASVALAQREADAGYRALVESVRHLEDVVGAQQATLRLLIERTLPDSLSIKGEAPVFPSLPSSTHAALVERVQPMLQ